MTIRLSIIPAGAVTDERLEPRDLQVLCLLGRHIDKLGWCFRSQVKMAAELHCGRSSVQRSVDRLIEAGWVEKKRRGQALPEGEEAGQPHAAYAYRVVLDRDDFAWESATSEASESHAENASREGHYPSVGTPPEVGSEGQNEAEGAQPDGHPGAQPYVGTGCPAIRGHHNVPSERLSLERERDARARDRKAKGLVNFEARWPTSAADDRQRTAYAWEALSDAEEEAAIGGIAPFLENLKKLGRKNIPAGWKYLEEKRWTLLETEKPASATLQKLEKGSAAAKAVEILYTLAGKAHVLTASFMRSSDGGLYYRREVTPRLLALSTEGDQSKWQPATHNQAGAWNGFLREFVTLEVWTRLRAGDRVPASGGGWPPKVDGTWSATALDIGCSEQELAEFTR